MSQPDSMALISSKYLTLAIFNIRLDLVPRKFLTGASHVAKDGTVLFPVVREDRPGKIWGFEYEAWSKNQQRYADELVEGMPARSQRAVAHRLLAKVRYLGRPSGKFLDLWWTEKCFL